MEEEIGISPADVEVLGILRYAAYHIMHVIHC
jgi:hypothetical protein